MPPQSTTASQHEPAFDAREATVGAVRAALDAGTTARAVTEAFLARIAALNGPINAVVALNPAALAEADAVDAALARGEPPGALCGVPVLLKDNFDVVGLPSASGCRALSDAWPSAVRLPFPSRRVPAETRLTRSEQDAPVVAALKRAGAVVLGKANQHELALEGLTVSSLGGQTRNAYGLTRTPGGSSGGSGAAVAASLAVFATGTDTVNSLRSPAAAGALCSLRPTWGLVGRAGVARVSFTQDVVGPIARSVRDVAIALTVMAGMGYDERDAATAGVPDAVADVDYARDLEGASLAGKRFGLIEGFFSKEGNDETAPVNDAMRDMVERLREAGATVVPVADAVFDSRDILRRCDTQRHEYREQLTAYLADPGLAGTHPRSMSELYATKDFLVIPAQYEYVNTALVSSTDDAAYGQILHRIRELRSHLLQTFERDRLDALIYPEQENLVVPIGSPSQSGRNGILAAVTGMPAAAVPVGFSPSSASAPEGVPIGMEMLCRPWEDAKLLQLARQVEKLRPIRKSPPFAERAVAVDAGGMDSVPALRPDASSIPAAYPVGQT